MIFDKDNDITLITQEKSSITELLMKLEVTYPKFKNDNVIVDLRVANKDALSNLDDFLELSNKHRHAKRSFVIVTDKIDLEHISEEIVVVPTLQEAYDVIEMEEMERDLGF